MGPRQHGRRGGGRGRGRGRGTKRKRQIDLNSLSKKQRKEYRNQGGTQNKNDLNGDKEERFPTVKQREDTDSSDDDETVTPYTQLVSSLSQNKDSEDEYTDEENADGGANGGTEEKPSLDDHAEASDSDVSDQELTVKEVPVTEEEMVDNEEEDETDDEVIEPGENIKDFSLQDTDPFSIHFEHDLPEDIADELAACTSWKKQEFKVSHVGSGILHWMSDSLKPVQKRSHQTDLKTLHVKHSLCSEVFNANRKLGQTTLDSESDGLTPFQMGLFGVLNEYKDLLYCERTAKNGEEIRLAYCLHALNHVLKTRSRVIAHNTKIKMKTSVKVDEEYRDQGLTRPKILIIVPFREAAKRVVDTFSNLLKPSDKSLVSNKTRFYKEYTPEPEGDKLNMAHKPEDYEATFSGNIDDFFRIGIGVAKKTLKLYTKFYSADIIIASPLGLRSLIGSEGDKERDYDFLSSIEMIILDQADIFMMQNWEHVLHLYNHLHLQPKESHGLDISRVRMWTLNGWSKFYRQNLVFSSVPSPEITALFNKQCQNYAGKVQISRQVDMGTICQITVQLPQVFHRIDSASYKEVAEDRFNYFIKKVFPQHKDPVMAQTLIFIPSYFDFVRVRNYFKRESVDFAAINEYTQEDAIKKARKYFGRRKVTFLVYTERFHFYRRMHIPGMRHIIFYSLPQYPHFYSELCNMLQDRRKSAHTQDYSCTVLYTKYEAVRLAEIVGTERAARMISGSKAIHMFATGENG